MNLWNDYLRRNGYEPTHGIVGVDPGKTTGLFFCLVYRLVDEEVTQHGVLLDRSQVAADQAHVHVDGILEVFRDCDLEPRRLHVAVEKYIITKRTARLTQQHDALEVTGAVKAVADKHDAHVWQFTPSRTKKFASDETLDRVGWFPRKMRGQRHARDAARQVWTCLAEVDFPNWEQNWSGGSLITDGGDLIYESLNNKILGGGDESGQR